jgi:hypothetical protein
MKMHYLVGIGLGCIANTCILGRAWAGPGPAEVTYDMLNLDPGVGWDSGPAHDERMYTLDGDWRPGFSKVECGESFPTMVSLQATNWLSGLGGDSGDPLFEYEYHWAAHSALCASSNTLWVDYPHGVSVWFGDQDVRRDTSTLDWAYGLVKAECGYNEVMTGFAEQNEGINEFRCSPAQTLYVGAALQASQCGVVDFDGHEGYDPFPGANRDLAPDSYYYYADDVGNWVSPAWNGFCGVNRYIKGFAVDSQNGTTRPVKLLCCGAQRYLAGVPCDADAQCVSGTCQFFPFYSAGVCH